ncbi:MAG: rRNA maturation RNase YbeY [Clostridiales Family XIII bacterium]|jgi:rRNA maturation RNase YbeY|nr:rRNA maturation RNase YbeY [Clostridiales Family XIII bacterium]
MNLIVDDEKGLLRLDRALLTRMAETAVRAEIAAAKTATATTIAVAAEIAAEATEAAAVATEATTASSTKTAAAEISLSVVTPEEMRELNKTHRGIDESTDVLSFPQFESAGEVRAAAEAGRAFSLGDIVINTEAAEAQAEDYGHSAEREQAYLFIHGLLHLLGHDHEDEAGKAAMREAEESALSEAGLGDRNPLFNTGLKKPGFHPEPKGPKELKESKEREEKG